MVKRLNIVLGTIVEDGEYVLAADFDVQVDAGMKLFEEVERKNERIAQLEAALKISRDIIVRSWMRPKGLVDMDKLEQDVWQFLRPQSETPEQTHARIVTETADAIAKERGLTSETK